MPIKEISPTIKLDNIPEDKTVGAANVPEENKSISRRIKELPSGIKLDDEKPESFLSNVIKPVKNIPKDIGEEFRAGTEMIKSGEKDISSGTVWGVAKGIGKEALGGLQQYGSPVSGAAKALVGDPARAAISQDTVYGRMAANTLEDAASIFGPGAVGELSKTISTASGPVRTLMENGVQLTPGQLNPKYAKRLEEAAKSIPILGSFIRSAEARTLDSFNVATVNKALALIGAKADAKTGREAIQSGQKILSNAYSNMLNKIPALHQDKEFDASINNLKSMAAELPSGISDRFNAILNNRVIKRFGDLKTMDGQTFKGVESELTNIAMQSKSSPDAAERQLGYAIDEVKSSLRDALGRQYPMLAENLSGINHAYSRFADIERAAGTRATASSRFTPSDLLRAIKRGDKSPRDRQFAAGNRELQNWGEDAFSVIGNTLSDSGTAERRAVWDVAGGGAAYYADPRMLTTMLGGSALYTAPGQAAVNAIVRGTPRKADILSSTGKAMPVAAGVPSIVEQIFGEDNSQDTPLTSSVKKARQQ
jgi:hypothetical protein